MPINVKGASKVLNNVMTRLLSDFQTLKFISVDKTADDLPRMYLGTTSVNWRYEEVTEPSTGEVREYVNFVTSNSQEESWAENCTQIEMIRRDNTFLRAEIVVKNRPKPPMYRWRFLITPNAQDNETLNG